MRLLLLGLCATRSLGRVDAGGGLHAHTLTRRLLSTSHGRVDL
jgi:hypothetical protein